jgi:hypothetical protein
MQSYKELTDKTERRIMDLRQRARSDPRRRYLYFSWANEVLNRWVSATNSYKNSEQDYCNLKDLIDRFP